MKRGLTHLSIWLILLLGMTLVLSSVTHARYQTEKTKSISFSFQNRWEPAVEPVTDETAGELKYRVKNTSQTAKTIVLRLKINGEQAALGMNCSVGGGEYTAVPKLVEEPDDADIICRAFDAAGREMTWTLSPDETLEVTVTDNNSQTIGEGAVSLTVKCCNG